MIAEYIDKKIIISYVPNQKLVDMPYKFNSNIWNTKKNEYFLA